MNESAVATLFPDDPPRFLASRRIYDELGPASLAVITLLAQHGELGPSRLLRQVRGASQLL